MAFGNDAVQRQRAGLDGAAGVVEVEGTHAPQLFATSSATWTTMQRHRHHIAMPGMQRRNIRRNGMHAQT